MEDDERSAVEDIRDWLDRPGKGAVWTTAVTSSEKQITKYFSWHSSRLVHTLPIDTATVWLCGRVVSGLT